MSETTNTTKKNLEVDAGFVNAINFTEEIAQMYNKITIDTGVLITSDSSQKILSKYGVIIDAGYVVSFRNGTNLSYMNGMRTITPNETVSEHTAVLINGKLLVEKGCAEIIKNFERIIVNGLAIYPDDIDSSKLQCHGSSVVYPADATLITKSFDVDEIFCIRAENNEKYFTPESVYFTDMDVDLQELIDKNVHIICKKAFVYQSLLRKALKLLDKKAEVETIPDGCAIIKDDVELCEETVERYGNKMYSFGSVFIPKEAKPILEKIEYLRSGENLFVCKEVPQELLKNCQASEDIIFHAGKLIYKQSMVTVDENLLNSNPEGISLMKISHISIDPALSVDALKAGLKEIVKCSHVSCTSEQNGYISTIAKKVSMISCDEQDDKENENGESTQGNNTVYIDTGAYEF